MGHARWEHCKATVLLPDIASGLLASWLQPIGVEVSSLHVVQLVIWAPQSDNPATHHHFGSPNPCSPNKAPQKTIKPPLFARFSGAWVQSVWMERCLSSRRLCRTLGLGEPLHDLSLFFWWRNTSIYFDIIWIRFHYRFLHSVGICWVSSRVSPTQGSPTFHPTALRIGSRSPGGWRTIDLLSKERAAGIGGKDSGGHEERSLQPQVQAGNARRKRPCDPFFSTFFEECWLYSSSP